MLSRISGPNSNPLSNNGNQETAPLETPSSSAMTQPDTLEQSTTTSLWNWASSGLSALMQPQQASSPNPSKLQEEATQFRAFATDLMVATAANAETSQEERRQAVRAVLAKHPAVVLWFVNGKNLAPITKAADLPSIANFQTPFLTSAYEIGSTIKSAFDTLDDFRIIGSSLSAARDAYSGASLSSLTNMVGAMGVDLGSSILHRTGRNVLVDMAVRAAQEKAESAFCALNQEARETLLEKLPKATFDTIAKQVNEAIEQVKISDSDEIKMLLDPASGFDLTQVPPAFREFFESVLTQYFDQLPLQDKRRLAIGLFSLPIDSSNEAKLAAILNNSGPAIQKLFQLFGEDVKSERVASVMKELKNQIKPFDTALAIAKIERDLGGNIDELFSDFGDGPIAAASVGQVYLATTRETDEDVVVKVMRPNLRERAAREIELLKELAPTRGTRKIVERLEESLLQELDFRNESRNLETGQAVYWKPQKGISLIAANELFETSSDVLVMERAYEKPINKFGGADLPVKSEALATFLETWYDEALFGKGFFHADLHAGNIFFETKSPSRCFSSGRKYQMTLIDFGNCGQLSRAEQKGIINFILGSATGSTTLIVNAFLDLCPTMTQEQAVRFQKDLLEIFAMKLDASETCNLIVNKAIERELGLPKNFILFNRGRAFLENQIRDTNEEIQAWDPRGTTPLKDATAIFGSLLKWRLGQDFLKSAIGVQDFSDAVLDPETLVTIADHYIVGTDEEEEEEEPASYWQDEPPPINLGSMFGAGREDDSDEESGEGSTCTIS